ncbi:MAG: hypothetical protein LBK28_03395 [Propionibacteriaceae bacterium]|jgi:hypothetical protein|nr:hypothetical protein [Propionibacteriaceae bacterium]
MVNATSPDFLQEWSWLDDGPADIQLDIGSYEVVAVVYELGSAEDTERCLAAVAKSSVQPSQLVLPEDLPDDAQWLWILPNTCEPKPDALHSLLTRAAKNPDVDVVAAVHTEPRRRGPATLIHSYGQTVSGFGRLRSLAEPGEFYQGQLRVTQVLGAPAAGMLVKSSLWWRLGGFELSLTPALWGLEFDWRANLIGAQVVVEPDAEVVVHQRHDPTAERAGILALASAHARAGLRWLVDLKLILVTLLAALGFALGKDMLSAGEEIAGLGRWLVGRRRRKNVYQRVKALETKREWVSATRALRPAPWSGLRRAVDAVAARVADWLNTFTGISDAASIDELTGDDFAMDSDRQRVPVILVGLVLALLGAIAAGRTLFGEGALQAARMLPASASWQDLVSKYLEPIPGTSGLATPPWEGIVGLFSLVSAGQPEWLVSIVVVGCVPLTWLAAYRFARQLVDSNALAGLAAGAYALAPMLSGGFNATGFAVAVWTLLLPIAAYSVLWWHREGRDTWRGAGAVALWLLLLTSLYPLAWPLAGFAFLAEAVLRPKLRVVLQRVFVLAVPALLVIGPWLDTLLTYPTRALVGIESPLDSNVEFAWWQVPLAATGGEFGPPLWISAACMGVLWLAALFAAVKKPKLLLLLIVAAVAAIAATILNRMLVFVPPGVWTRPTGLELIILMIGCLTVVAVVGFDGVGSQLRSESISLSHIATLGTCIGSVAALLLGGVWWVWMGQLQVVRKPVGELPVFVMAEANADLPSRTLAIAVGADSAVSWMLVDGDYPRLGDAERGLVYSGDAQAIGVAESVVSRLMVGSADEELANDLARLGVSHIWLTGGDETLRMGISNTPGLAGETGDTDIVWPVPDTALFTIWTQQGKQALGERLEVPASDDDTRVLIFAQPADPRWRVSVAGQALPRVESAGPEQRFALGTASGVISFELRQDPPNWAWAQLVGLLFLIGLALPGFQRRSSAPVGKRLNKPVPKDEESMPLPRRALGVAE